MKKTLFLTLVLLFPFVAEAAEVSYADLQDSTATAAQIRLGADFDWRWNRVNLGLSEELRFNLMPAQEFYLANTTAYVDVKIIRSYFHAHAGYQLRLRANKFGTANLTTGKLLRHRVFFGLTEHVKFGMYKQFTLSLRERAVLNMRFDDPNLYEKQAYAWEMRYRLQLQYKALSLPLTPYVWTEIDHTCNATDFQKYYNNGHNYITASKTALGLKWKLNSNNTLNFFIRYDWTRDIDVDSNKLGTIVKQAIQEKQHAVILGVNYNFGYKKR